MAKDPAFLFYSSDFLVGTTLMNFDQRGKYITLLCLQHQIGHLTEEDMLKICSTHDKDIFDKFSIDQSGRYFNERLEVELQKRINYSNSRKTNRLGKKTTPETTSHDSDISVDMSVISKSHVLHMENENTTTSSSNLVDNAGLNSNDIINNTKGCCLKDMTNTCSTHVEDMLKSEKNDYSCDIYEISTTNQHLEHPLSVCAWNYFNNPIYSQAREMHCVRLGCVHPDPSECEKLLPEWADSFNRGLINDGKSKMPMAGNGNSWLPYFPNWIKKVVEKRGKGIDPKILFTKDDFKSQTGSRKSKNLSDISNSVEDQKEFYKRKS